MTATLRRLVRRATEASAAALERCDLCGEVLPDEHRHLIDVTSRDVRCACRACSILFDRREASLGQLQRIPDRRVRLEGFQMTDGQWEGLRVPVGLAFLFSTNHGDGQREGRGNGQGDGRGNELSNGHGATTASGAPLVLAYYPSPMGAAQSLITPDAWRELVARNGVLETMAPDVEALLIHRVGAARGYYLVGIDECYRLVGLIRRRWRGLTGGQEVWRDVQAYFESLDARSKPLAAQHQGG